MNQINLGQKEFYKLVMLAKVTITETKERI